MCSVSAVHDFMHQNHPPTDPWWSRPKLEGYEEIIRRLQEIDDKLKLEACDPEKARFIQEVRDRLDRIEKQVGLSDGITETQ